MKASEHCANFLVDNYNAWIGAKQELLARYVNAHKDSSLELAGTLLSYPLNIELCKITSVLGIKQSHRAGGQMVMVSIYSLGPKLWSIAYFLV